MISSVEGNKVIFYSSSCQAGVKISLLVIWDVLLFEISPLELRITERLFWWKQFSMAFNYQWKNTTALSIRYYHGKKFRFLRLGCRDTWDRFKNAAVGAPSIGKHKIMISDVFVFFFSGYITRWNESSITVFVIRSSAINILGILWKQ